MIDRAVVWLVGMLCVFAPVIIALKDGVWDDESDVYHWLAKQPLHVIYGLQMLMFVGFLLLMVAAGLPR